MAASGRVEATALGVGDLAVVAGAGGCAAVLWNRMLVGVIVWVVIGREEGQGGWIELRMKQERTYCDRGARELVLYGVVDTRFVD